MSVKSSLIAVWDWCVCQFRTIYDFFTREEVTVSVGDLMHDRGTIDGVQLLVATRLMDIEAYVNNRDSSFIWQKRMSICEQVGSVSYDDEKWRNAFESLITSYQKNGYNGKSHFLLDQDKLLRNGTHRTALHLFLGLFSAKAWIMKRKYPVFDNSYRRFTQYLPYDTIGIINDKLDEIRNYLISDGVAFCSLIPMSQSIDAAFPSLSSSIHVKRRILLRAGVGLQPVEGDYSVSLSVSGQFKLVLFSLDKPCYHVKEGYLVSDTILSAVSSTNSSAFISLSCLDGKRVYDMLSPFFLEDYVVIK